MLKKFEIKRIINIIEVAIFIIVIIVFYIFNNKNSGEEYMANAEEYVLENDNIIIENNEEKESKIKVYITGEISNQGVIELTEGDRIEDAINMAGGVTENASLKNVNLAYKLEDGQKIYIPNKNDSKDIEIISTENGENIIENTNNSGISKVNINNASLEKICELPGVGKTLAQKIIDYRNENGKFKSIDDLKNVSGIGEKKFESIKEHIVIK